MRYHGKCCLRAAAALVFVDIPLAPGTTSIGISTSVIFPFDANNFSSFPFLLFLLVSKLILLSTYAYFPFSSLTETMPERTTVFYVYIQVIDVKIRAKAAQRQCIQVAPPQQSSDTQL